MVGGAARRPLAEGGVESRQGGIHREQRFDVNGRTVFITGAARGIGAASAERLHARGANVALVGLEPELLEENAARLGDRAASFETEVEWVRKTRVWAVPKFRDRFVSWVDLDRRHLFGTAVHGKAA